MTLFRHHGKHTATAERHRDRQAAKAARRRDQEAASAYDAETIALFEAINLPTKVRQIVADTVTRTRSIRAGLAMTEYLRTLAGAQ